MPKTKPNQRPHDNNGPSKPRGRRSEQRQISRVKLIKAARAIFIGGLFRETSVDEIARNAHLSRAAFYLHFKSKEEILQAVLYDEMEAYVQHYRTISVRKASSRTSVIKWFGQFITGFRESGELTALYPIITSVKHSNKENHQRRCAAVEILGHRLPRLRIFKEDGSINVRRHWRTVLFVYQLEQLSYAIAFGQSYIDTKVALDVLADHFMTLFD